jgi:hypothetical protein
MSAAPPPPPPLLLLPHRQRLLLRRGAPALAGHWRLVHCGIKTFVSLQHAESGISRDARQHRGGGTGERSVAEAGRTGGGGLELQGAAPAPLLR